MTDWSFNKNLVLELLRGVLPQGNLITDHAGLRPYECDGLTAIREQPWLVALPETEQQVVSIVRICNEYGVPIVARGAGTAPIVWRDHA